MNKTTAQSLLIAADALEAEAKLPRNRKYRNAYELSARSYREQANAALEDQKDELPPHL